MSDEHDANVLVEAAEILKRRSHRPNGFVCRVAIDVLQRLAVLIRSGLR
jgi:hypothetical protein